MAAIGPDLAYAVGLDGRVTALSDGAVRWSIQTSGAIGSVATLSQGILYVSVSDGTIEALDAGTGQLRWSIHVNGDPGPVIVDRGRLYVGTSLGQLAAFSEYAASATP